MKGSALFGMMAVALASSPLSATNYTKTEVITYHDNLSRWVLGQVETLVTSGVPTSRTEYDPVTALPLADYAYSSPDPTQSFTWNLTPGTQAGTLSTVTDGNGRVTTLSNWKRGIPQLIQYPVLAGQAAENQSATVNDLGQITSITDENLAVTSYTYDAAGRLASITYPTEGGATVYNGVTQSFTPQSTANYGLPVGHWRQLRTEGTKIQKTYYDAMWRPVIEEVIDGTNEATRSQVIKRYDDRGRLVFQSYPFTGLVNYSTAIVRGTTTTYDVLDRVTEVKQDAEPDVGGATRVKTRYLSGFRTEITDANNKVTTTSFMAWDKPLGDFPVRIEAPEGQVTTIERNIFGRPRVIARGTSAGPLLQRRLVYDGKQRVCKTIEPETGTTVLKYDGAGNLVSSAAGLALPTVLCEDTHPSVAAREVLRIYDARNRLKLLSFPDGNGDQTWSYTKAGLPSQIVSWNIPTAGTAARQVVNTYLYNNRGLLTNESLGLEGWHVLPIAYEYDANASLKATTYPSGQRVAFNPNALGQPTHIASASQTYASNIQYWPHGATKSFTYGNGIAFAMTPNERLLPYEATSNVQRYQYHYDANGNPKIIYDFTQRPGVDASHYHRVMEYDGLNRLTVAGSAAFGGDHFHRFSYDVLDNMTAWTLGLGGKNNHYVYTPGTNRLQQITSGANGPTIEGFAFDDQGNIKQKSGAHYDFDYGNRLRQAATFEGTERYRYDAHGRRALSSRIVGPADQFGVIFSHYGQSGQLLFQRNDRSASGKSTDYIYLGGTLLAERETATATGATSVVFTHTDALGSPVAKTNAAGSVLERMMFDPYGGVIEGANRDGPGYTGHVRDIATGMNYMQQRYYDPGIGVMLSVDPVGAFEGDARHFNRYAYAYGNPYRFNDPDGRCPSCIGAGVGAGLDVAIQLAELALGTRDDFSVRSVAVSAGTGALGVGIVGKLGKVASLAADVGISIVSTKLKGDDPSIGSVAADVIGGRVGGAFAKRRLTGSPEHRVAQRGVDRLHRIGDKPGARPAQQRRANEAAPTLEQAVEKRATRSGIVAGGVGSATVSNAEKLRSRRP